MTTLDLIDNPSSYRHPIVVKPLDWVHHSDTYWDTWTVYWSDNGQDDNFCRVSCFMGMGGDGLYDLILLGRPSSVHFETLADAQAAAQEQWNRFILSAIQP